MNHRARGNHLWRYRRVDWPRHRSCIGPQQDTSRFSPTDAICWFARRRDGLEGASRSVGNHHAFLRRPPVGQYWVYVDGYYLLISAASGTVLDVVIAH
jgi:Ni/Co efflux regulator RcnB